MILLATVDECLVTLSGSAPAVICPLVIDRANPHQDSYADPRCRRGWRLSHRVGISMGVL